MAVKGMSSKATGENILNSIRATIIASGDLTYQERIPIATQNNLKDVGQALLDYQPAMNQFLNELINRIGMTVIKQRMYRNKLAFFKRGFLEYGDSIQEIFVDIAKAHHYLTEPPVGNEGDVFAQEKPKVLEAFHRVNREDYYKVTINEAMLKRAFTGYAQFDTFVAGIFNSLYNADEYDEYVLFKHLLGSIAKNTYKVQVEMPVATDKSTSEAFSIQMRAQALNLEYMSRNYNQLGVATHTPLSEQVLILRSDVVPVIDVMQLANNFNLNLAQPLSGRIIVVDDFGIENDDIIGMIVDSEFSMIYDTRFETNSIYNPQYLYWNWFLHHHQIISSSPFSNCIAFTTADVPVGTITSVVISPSQGDVQQGNTLQFESNVTYTGNANTSVTYSLTSTDELSAETTISSDGLLSVGLNEKVGNVITVTSTSVGDPSISSDATITVTARE